MQLIFTECDLAGRGRRPRSGSRRFYVIGNVKTPEHM